MAYILSIESATKAGSVALHHQGQLVAASLLVKDNSHSNSLALMASQLLAHAQVQPQQLGAVAVSAGPGSYTGLRIGWSIAKGICFAANLPLITVPTLEMLAAACLPVAPDTVIMPCIDARRMEVFQCLYDNQLQQLTEVAPAIINTPDELAAFRPAGKNLIICGDGAAKFVHLISDQGINLHSQVTWPEARHMGALAWQRFEGGQFADLAYAVPDYLKEPRLST